MRITTAALALALTTALAGAARADQTLPPGQRAKVEQTLKAEGFTAWKEIELDDGHIEVDDAVDAAGKRFDLHLDKDTLAITKREPE